MTDTASRTDAEIVRQMASQNPPLDSYPQLAFWGEDMRAVLRVEPCDCGGRIVQLVGQQPGQVVQSHNLSDVHQAYRRGREGAFT